MTRQENCVIVDIRDLVQDVNRSGRFQEHILESWLARTYCKSYGIPCISVRLFDSVKGDNVPFERIRLTLVADRLSIDPILHLPKPEANWLGDEGIWFFIKGEYLAMGNSRAVEKCWRNMYP